MLMCLREARSRVVDQGALNRARLAQKHLHRDTKTIAAQHAGIPCERERYIYTNPDTFDSFA